MRPPDYANPELTAMTAANARGFAGPAAQVAQRLADYLELAKPRIVVLELIVAAAAACVASRHATIDAAAALYALVGTALVAASASILNQWIERDADARMRRTADRPLPAGRVSGAEAFALAVATLATGVWILATQVNALTCALGIASWLIYVAIYTPLKSRSHHNTTVGAIAGAMPLMMGWTATGAPLSLTAWSLAAVLFLWQFPHFMAIAWLYRRDYAAAGRQMLTVVDPSGVRPGLLAIIGAMFLIPVSLIPALDPAFGSPFVYSLWAIALGGAQLALALRFAARRDDTSARDLLRSSLIFLPAWMAVLVMVSA